MQDARFLDFSKLNQFGNKKRLEGEGKGSGDKLTSETHKIRYKKLVLKHFYFFSIKESNYKRINGIDKE